LAHGGPGAATRFLTLSHFPACTSGVLAAIVTQRTHNAGEAGDRPARLPTAETEMFSRGCPKLTPGARSSHDRAPDRWDQANAQGNVETPGSISKPWRTERNRDLFGAVREAMPNDRDRRA
jgi:hypothetical protein